MKAIDRLNRCVLPMLASTALTILLSSCTPSKTPVEKFEQLLRKAADKTQILQGPVYMELMGGGKGWAKEKNIVSDLKYDVTRTDSLVSPLQGKAVFKLTQTRTDLFNDKGLAEKSQDYNGWTTVESFELAYVYQDSKWLFKSGSREELMFGTTPNTLELSPSRGESYKVTSNTSRVAAFLSVTPPADSSDHP